jgi:hypothetical protein
MGPADQGGGDWREVIACENASRGAQDSELGVVVAPPF